MSEGFAHWARVTSYKIKSYKANFSGNRNFVPHQIQHDSSVSADTVLPDCIFSVYCLSGAARQQRMDSDVRGMSFCSHFRTRKNSETKFNGFVSRYWMNPALHTTFCVGQKRAINAALEVSACHHNQVYLCPYLISTLSAVVESRTAMKTLIEIPP